jgi:uncharacterized protein
MINNVTTAIRIRAGSVTVEAELSGSTTAQAIRSILPYAAHARRWGEEIYFPIPVKQELDANAVEVVENGALGYWPSGSAFCIFFGPTPISKGNEIRPASAVNVVGKVLGDTEVLKTVADGDAVLLKLR